VRFWTLRYHSDGNLSSWASSERGYFERVAAGHQERYTDHRAFSGSDGLGLQRWRIRPRRNGVAPGSGVHNDFASPTFGVIRSTSVSSRVTRAEVCLLVEVGNCQQGHN
jgi:hypothetical protein